jgi:ABC-type Fe3+ transport system permease subunit
MKHAERVTPIAAVTSALATLLCCLPIGFAAAAATASVAAVVSQLRPWFLGVSVVLVAIGFVQVYRRKSCERQSPATLAILWISAAIVVVVIVFPQAIAGVVADLLPPR